MSSFLFTLYTFILIRNNSDLVVLFYYLRLSIDYRFVVKTIKMIAATPQLVLVYHIIQQ